MKYAYRPGGKDGNLAEFNRLLNVAAETGILGKLGLAERLSGDQDM